MVQGVGFRPLVFQMAKLLNLNGWVSNSSEGVTIELEGDEDSVDTFLPQLERELPPHSSILSTEKKLIESCGEKGFTIKESSISGEIAPHILPDIAVCQECLEEMFDPLNRRFGYPFINCTHCGPRFSIIQSLPYDRPNTTMDGFEMCEECQAEYEDPANRRFHAQPIACPDCGPSIEFHRLSDAAATCLGEPAMESAVDSLKSGEIVALKGLGGFQLLVDATNPQAVQRLRERKQRGNKPFAVMFPDIGSAREAVKISAQEEKLLQSSEAPIVLIEKRNSDFDWISPRNPYLGVFLPYSPIHHQLLKLFQKPLVTTSGNLSNEPICIDNEEAFSRLGRIADAFLVHNRPIQRPVDDSVVRMNAGKLQVIRRARGYAPYPIQISQTMKPTLAVGGHLKNAIAIAKGKQIILSQHIGNLDTAESVSAFQSAISDFNTLYGIQYETVVADKHPDYVSTQLAEEQKPGHTQYIQHHLAHVFSCMAEHGLKPPLTGIAWDGTGYGEDGTIWGAESFKLTEQSSRRIASIYPFQLPGGESAIHETERIAISLLHTAGLQTPHNKKAELLLDLMEKDLQSPYCSSMGRLFDGISALIGLCKKINFEAEAAMLLEFEAQKSDTPVLYDFPALNFDESKPTIFDWRPMIGQIVEDLRSRKSTTHIARKFHNTLAETILEIARLSNENKVLLTGGCFQNKVLTEMAIRKLTEAGYTTYTHSHIPPNDGGLAAGQVYAQLFKSNLKII